MLKYQKVLYFIIGALFIFMISVFLNNNLTKKEEASYNVKIVENDNHLTKEQALKNAKEYLSLLAYSHSKLVSKLEFDGFSKDEIDYAIKSLNINWKEQAVLKAEDYLRIGEFSREKLSEQLIYEGFTKEEVNYAIDAVDID